MQNLSFIVRLGNEINDGNNRFERHRPFTKGKIAGANAFIFCVVLGREVRANECT